MKCRTVVLLLAVAASGSMSLGQVTGTVKLDGPAPEIKKIDMATNPDCAKLHKDPVDDDTVVIDDKGDLQNVIVSIKEADGQELGGDVPKDAVVLDQQGCMYSPHVVALMAGQTLVVKNSDDFLHNVHSLPDQNAPINDAMPVKDEDGLKITDLKIPEIFMIKCEVHPWMKAWVGVFDHPYFAVTKDDGTYSFDTKGLKDGEYTLEAWQEKYGTVSQKITVKDGKAKADFKFSQPKADAGNAPVKFATMLKEKPCCSTITRAALAAKTN